MPYEICNDKLYMQGIGGADNLPRSTFFIVECAAFAYSVLRGWGYRSHYPVAVIAESMDITDDIAGKLGIFQTNVLGTNLPPEEFKKALEEYHDDLCVLLYTQGRYSSYNMEFLLSLYESGGYGALSMDMLLLVVFQKVIPKEYQGVCSIAIEAKLPALKCLNRSIMGKFLECLKAYLLTYSQIVEHELGRQSIDHCEDKDFRFWSAVVEMIGLVFTSADRLTDKELKAEYYDLLEKAYELSESYEFNQQIPALFREAFDNSIPNTCKVLPEANANELSKQDLSDIVLYDSEHYYIPESLFAEICKPLNDVCTANQIKDVLAKEGILCTQGQGRIYKTIKKNVGASSVPQRFIWLKRAALEDDAMEMSFLDLYMIRGGKCNVK